LSEFVDAGWECRHGVSERRDVPRGTSGRETGDPDDAGGPQGRRRRPQGRSGRHDVVDHDDPAGRGIPCRQALRHVAATPRAIEATLIGGAPYRTQEPCDGQVRSRREEVGHPESAPPERTP
jgi:hypothetical protein